jgi:predicted kinase
VATVVLVVGRPAAGKSTVAAAIGRRFGLPVLAKDDVKEVLFDALGTGDRAWSIRLGRATFELLDLLIERMLQAGASFVVDAAFDAAVAGPRLASSQQRYGFDAVQVHCTAPRAVLLDRFASRAAADRHPGHVDAANLDEFAASLDVPRQERFDLAGPVLAAAVDAAGRLDLEPLLARLTPLLPPPAEGSSSI